MGMVSASEAMRIATAALSSGAADDPLARDRGQLLQAIRIAAPNGEPAGWFVPVGLEGALLGFVQLGPDGLFRRYASFHGRSESIARCPRASDWVDPEVITERARPLSAPGSELSAPVLSYDKHPDRLAWMIQETSHGASSPIFVAGTEAWRG